MKLGLFSLLSTTSNQDGPFFSAISLRLELIPFLRTLQIPSFGKLTQVALQMSCGELKAIIKHVV